MSNFSNNFKHYEKSSEIFAFALRKGVMFFKYLNSWNGETSYKDYRNDQSVWERYNFDNLSEYQDFIVIVMNCYYLMLLDFYRARFVTIPSLLGTAALKLAKMELEILTDVTMLHVYEDEIRGVITSVINVTYKQMINIYLIIPKIKTYFSLCALILTISLGGFYLNQLLKAELNDLKIYLCVEKKS